MFNKRINDIESIKKESRTMWWTSLVTFLISVPTLFLLSIELGLVFLFFAFAFLNDKRYWDTKRNIIEFTKKQRR